MKNTFWNRQVVCGSVVKLENIVSVWGGIDPVDNWNSGYSASFSIDNYNTGFVSFEIADGIPNISTVATIKDVTNLVATLLNMIADNPPRIGEWDS